MTVETRRILINARTSMVRFSNLLANPDEVTALDLQEMVPDLEDLAVEINQAVKDIEHDEEMAVAE